MKKLLILLLVASLFLFSACNTHSKNSDSSTESNTEDVYYELLPLENSKYQVTIVVPEAYLNHPETVYPVVIDPTVVMSNISYIDDTYIIAGDASYHYNEPRLRIGNYNGNTAQACRTYINFYGKPALFGYTINSAQLNFNFYTGQTTPAGGVDGRAYRMTSAWSAASLNANSSVSYTSTGSAFSSSHNLDYYSFDVTNMVDAWYNGGAGEYGFMVTYNNTALLDYNSLYSAQCGIADYVPKLYITYTAPATPPAPSATVTNIVPSNYSVSNQPYVHCYAFGMCLPTTTYLSVAGYTPGDNLLSTKVDVINQFNPTTHLHARSVGVIGKDDLINPNTQFKMVMKIYREWSLLSGWHGDYHFMIQCSNGTWAHKRGDNNSQNLGAINPTTYSWPGGYDSEPVYFAVTVY